MGGVAAEPAEALDAALEPLALGDPDHVDELASREDLAGERLAHRIGRHLLGLLEADLAHDPHRGHVDLLEDAGDRLADVLLLRLEPELEGVVTVLLAGPVTDDRAGPGLDDRHRDVTAVVAEDLGHADLAADESFFACHWFTRSSQRHEER